MTLVARLNKRNPDYTHQDGINIEHDLYQTLGFVTMIHCQEYTLELCEETYNVPLFRCKHRL